MNAEVNQLDLLKADDLKIITMDGNHYIGIIKDEITIEYLKYCKNGFDESDLVDWFKKWNIETLETITLSPSQGMRYRSLNPKEKSIFLSLQARMHQSKMYAMNYWENEVFDKIG